MLAGQSEGSEGEGELYDAKERRGNFRRKASEWVRAGNPQRISGGLASGEGQGLRAWLQMEMSGRPPDGERRREARLVWFSTRGDSATRHVW